ncbi:MAG TPA: methyltransferase [Solimonas sp.]
MFKRMQTLGWILILALTAPAQAQDALKAAIDAPQRTPEFVARDGYRHPYQTLTFFGIKPDMTVVELSPGAGWYTEILAPYLKDRGQLYAAHFDPDTKSEYFQKTRKAFIDKLKAQPEVYGKVAVTIFDPPKQVNIAPPGSADLVLTFRNVHNWYMRGGGQDKLDAAFKAMYVALKPGGTLGVVDHRLPADRPASAQEDSGYLHEAFVIAAAERAGFKLAATSEINANPKDTADHPNGVWSLLPSLRVDDAQKDKYKAIGESDRMTLKFIKPLTS